MRFAIIAAGEGSRLAAEGITAPKPLVEVRGEKLIDRLIRIFMDNEAEEIVVICNDLRPEVARHLNRVSREGLGGRSIPLRVVVKTTPSSMHSLAALSSYLDGAPFCLTTVDTIFDEQEFKRYVSDFKQAVEAQQVDGMMGVTDYIDDEKPLYVETDGTGRITAFLDKSDECKLISGGIYSLTPKALVTLKGCMERGEHRMRNFQRALVADGQRLQAWLFHKVFDIDHAEDIKKAEL